MENLDSSVEEFSQFSSISSSSNDRTESPNTSLLPALWDLPPGHGLQPSDAFAQYYKDCLIFIEGPGLAIHTKQDLIDLINFIRHRTTITRAELTADFEKHCSSIGSSLSALEAAIRIWLMISIDGWEPHRTLQEYINGLFPRMDANPSHSGVKPFPLSFNINNIRKIGGFDIAWTESLENHLTMSVDGTPKQLRVFHMAPFLQGYRHSCSQVFPPGLLEETARTISLLIPFSNLECRKWMRKTRIKAGLDIEEGRLPIVSRDISQYPYWGRQLLELRDEYDRTEPTTLKQWFRDKRNPNQRYTFWIAAIALSLALLFGLIQSITGILQVIYK
ncbi:hypothetical protein FE257_004551 [Aspergillus nanangensis]|uniref:Uncharacterized protein n=1 Tax=Aspergillus nanangensis TaxID=2582783 RepID=A0AAD4GYI0_ASPNN|nr:hypothetical protein FE257_004551 [Aspergillus nanangensis]